MAWLLQNWRAALPEPWACVLLAVVAAVCGAIVGAEREKKEKPAGLRTVTMVCLGSAIFTMISSTSDPASPSRISAQIVSGIGFLGAGAILRGPAGVTGVTTAAAIWVIAAIGMVVGAGYAVAGLALSLLVAGLLTIIASVEISFLGRCQLNSVLVVFNGANGKAMVKINGLLDDFHIRREPEDLTIRADGQTELRTSYCRAHRHHRELLAQLAALPEVLEVHPGPPTGASNPHPRIK